uniref:FAR1-related sequence 11-like HTH-like domain-containing protein n=1 Tax=Lactuca sativa TaxID=4236 RepID=A0A9R1UZY0_LACSA|nr:hypothetical protein LSAT_V11C700384520 [Lactuca sativa]
MEERIFFDLNEVPVEENSINARHEETAIEGHSQNNKTIFDEPFVGQYFLSEEEALIFCQNYARKKGFSIRKGRFVNKKTGGRKRRKLEFKKDYTEKKQETEVHNHVLLNAHEVCFFLPSYRNITLEDEKHILLLKEEGSSVTQIMHLIELERNVRHG